MVIIECCRDIEVQVCESGYFSFPSQPFCSSHQSILPWTHPTTTPPNLGLRSSLRQITVLCTVAVINPANEPTKPIHFAGRVTRAGTGRHCGVQLNPTRTTEIRLYERGPKHSREPSSSDSVCGKVDHDPCQSFPFWNRGIQHRFNEQARSRRTRSHQITTGLFARLLRYQPVYSGRIEREP